MKKIFGFLGMIILVQVLNAQDCTSYFPTQKGAEVEMTSYDAKGKETSTSLMKVKDVENTPEGLKIKVESTVTIEDKKKKEEENPAMTTSLTFYCKDGEFYMDMKEFMSNLSMQQYSGMEIDASSKDMAIPADPKTGQSLDDGNLTMVVSNKGVKMVTVVMDITNRKVVGFEKITTPAGTFDCFKVSYEVSSSFGFIKKTGSASVWYAKGIGTVKSENYNKKGKLTDYSLLTRLTR